MAFCPPYRKIIARKSGSLSVQFADPKNLPDVLPVGFRLAPRRARSGVKLQRDEMFRPWDEHLARVGRTSLRAAPQLRPSSLIHEHQIDRRFSSGPRLELRECRC